ncbi:patatin-like phospholipase family protein [Polynucleobacter asymbioticus]|uniref:patatin-like phospholipase family protein n=1 Tax=Polynucleobacter asymbioticus TaxID=576611 RepID=UPI001BFEDD84|nr:patatin-like phospholipase family protein [Polynucleobacter asymbioticus]QWD86076.1 patatin-like phospholipase family protein [Polynucleobacter asymbioticus]
MKYLKILGFLLLGLVVSIVCLYLAYANKKPWLNQPLKFEPSITNVGLGTKILGDHTDNFSTVVVLTFSGGGTRAAAFSYGVLEGLRDSKIGKGAFNRTLLDEVDLVSGVSGGSILASYFVAFGSETFKSFKDQFLYADFETNLVKSSLRPDRLFGMMSPWYGRGDVLVEQLNNLFQDKTFSNLPDRPRLLVSATDLATSRPFPFTEEQFSLICSDLRSVPLAYAVGSSSSVPVVFSPIVLQNYSNTSACIHKSPITLNTKYKHNYHMDGLYEDKSSYLNSPDRRYIHLVDGAVSDNLGLLSLLEQSKSESIASLVDSAPKNSVHNLVFIVVNSEIPPLRAIDQSGVVPNVGQVINAIRTTKNSQASADLSRVLKTSIGSWEKQLRARNDSRSPFANDIQIHLVMVNLLDTPDLALRDKLVNVSTTLQLPKDVVDDLIGAGRLTLYSQSSYANLMKTLGK